jgi:hypothetical protein
MTTTTARKTASPRTGQQLEADLSRLEHQLTEAQRANSVARSALGGHIAGGDAEEIAECRREIAATAAKAKDITESIEATQDAIRFARARARTAAAGQAYGHLKKHVSDTRTDIEVLGDSITAFGVALKAAIAGLESVEAQMRTNGITPDAYVLRAKLNTMVDMALHLESDGLVGRNPTLDTHPQLRSNGRASLHRAAAEWHALTMQTIRTALNVTRE